jgi:uncharacterized membrane protein
MSEEMRVDNADVTSDDRLFAALAYVFSPLMPVLILLVQDKKDRPFIRAHNAQALVAGGLLWLLAVPATLGCGTIAWLIMLYWGYKAYQGEYVTIPVVTDLVKGQNWG